MRKKYIKTVAALTVISMLCLTGISACRQITYNGKEDIKDSSMLDTGNIITVDKAKEIALKHAGVLAENVTFAKEELDYDDNRQVYNIEFHDSDVDYDYEIDALTGDIIKFDKNAENSMINTASAETSQTAISSTISAEQKSAANSQTSAAQNNVITEEKAKEIALKHAGLSSSEVIFTKTKLDYDDGRQEYNVEFYKGNTDYDYEIDAISGSIISYDKEEKPRQKTTGTKAVPKQNTVEIANTGVSSNIITVERAKEISLNHAGLAASDIVFSKAELDYDDGRQEYNIEFYKGNVDYDYKLDAVTGDIIKYNIDND